MGDIGVDELISSIKDRTTYVAYDALGRKIYLGSFVTYTYNTKTGVHEHTGIVKEIIFKDDGSVLLRVAGRMNTPVDSRGTKAATLSEREALIVEEFAKRGVKLELSEVRHLADVFSSLDSVYEFPEPTHEGGRELRNGDTT
jgi:hypothetical protein